MSLPDIGDPIAVPDAEAMVRHVRTSAYRVQRGAYANQALGLLNRANADRHLWEERIHERRVEAMRRTSDAERILAGDYTNTYRSTMSAPRAVQVLERVLHQPAHYLTRNVVLAAVVALGTGDELVQRWRAALAATVEGEQDIIDNLDNYLANAPVA